MCGQAAENALAAKSITSVGAAAATRSGSTAGQGLCADLCNPKAMKGEAGTMTKLLFFPVVLYLAVYWTCYEIFWWAFIEERSPWTRSLNGGKGSSTPIADAMEFARELVHSSDPRQSNGR